MLRLLGDKIGIEGIDDPDVSPTGLIIIPDSAKSRCDQGIVKYTGPNCRHLKEGDYVLFSPYSGDLVFLEDEGRVIVMREVSIIAVIHPPGTDIPGLYFRDALGGGFFTASYEVASQFIASAFRNSEWRRKYDLKAKMIGTAHTRSLELKDDIEPDWIEEARQEERERCAKLAEEYADFFEPLGSNKFGRDIAALIREPAQLEPTETT